MSKEPLKILGRTRSNSEYPGNHNFYIVTLHKGAIDALLNIMPDIGDLIESRLAGEFNFYGVEMFAPGYVEAYSTCPPLPPEGAENWVVIDRAELLDDDMPEGAEPPEPQYAHVCTLVLQATGILFKWYEKHGSAEYETDAIDLDELRRALPR